jgi:hypothetical protein
MTKIKLDWLIRIGKHPTTKVLLQAGQDIETSIVCIAVL